MPWDVEIRGVSTAWSTFDNHRGRAGNGHNNMKEPCNGFGVRSRASNPFSTIQSKLGNYDRSTVDIGSIGADDVQQVDACVPSENTACVVLAER